jgi:Uma2 family endonuclease
MTYTKKLTFEDYLILEDTGFEGRAELIDGELVELPAEAGLNLDIATFIQMMLIRIGIPYFLIHTGRCELQTPVLETKDAANRYPDLVVLRPEHIPLTRNRMTITLDMPPPQFVLEVVSPGKTNRDRDYSRKRSQYAAVGIPEYVIADPGDQIIIVLTLDGAEYKESSRHQGVQSIQLRTFPQLRLTAAQIFSAGQGLSFSMQDDRSVE